MRARRRIGAGDGALLSARAGLALALLVSSGCGLLLDLDPPDDGGVLRADAGAFDAGTSDAGAHDAGSRDGGDRCGDGVVQPSLGEECDELSATCVDCRRVCDCPDIARPCLDRIDCVEGACVARLFPDGTECVRDTRDGLCSGGLCIPAQCGDSTIQSGEECDDGNRTGGDGCEPDCVFSCHSDDECDDGDACNGVERCIAVSTGSRMCQRGPAPSIDACQVCDPDVGPYLPDADGDGFVADEGQPCDPQLIDCDDGDPGVFPGATEVCNGIDDDCDGARDEDILTVTCATDVDGDGYPGDPTGTMLESCTVCPDGTVPVRKSSTGALLIDCWDVDDAFGPIVNPAQTGFFVDPYCAPGTPGCVRPFDYDCNGVEEQQDTRVGPNCDLLSLAGCRGDGWIAPVPPCGAHSTYANCGPFLIVACSAERFDRQQSCR